MEIERELGERRERERLMREMGLTDEGESVCGVRDGLLTDGGVREGEM